jgi:TPR repeat protein
LCHHVAVFALATLAGLSAQTRGIRPIVVGQKAALVIGNTAYTRSPLANSGHDADSMTAELRSLGFTVNQSKDVNLREMARAIDSFAGRLHSGDLALFYYSGHGMQINGENYLLPVDFEAAAEADVPYTAYSANRLRDKLEQSGARLRIVILDACRDNPYKPSRGGPSGLAPMSSTAEGTLIAYATGDNRTASDNPGQQNGLFTQYLLAALHEPGLELHEIFKKVKEEVYYGSNKQQNPFTYDDVAGSYYFRPGTATAPPSSAPAPAPRPDAAAEAWALLKNSTNPDDFDDFARAFATSDLAATARMRAAQLRRAMVANATNAVMPRVTQPPVSPPQSVLDPQAVYQQGKQLYDQKNYTRAFPLLMQAANAGVVEAMELVGYSLHHAQGVAQDYVQAMQWYRKAAEGGNAAAMEEIGFLYHNGLGVPMDFDVAMQWYRQGADRGSPSAMNNIGFLYYNGVGVPQNFASALQWFEKAANAGNPTACAWLGQMYEQGQGTRRDLTRAREWYRKGAQRGNPRSIQRLRELGG